MSKILIVEDNPEVAELLQDVLKAEGFETQISEDGYQGIEFTHRFKPHLIILDLMLPAGGGFYVLEKLGLSSMTKGIPILVLTASKDPEHRKKAEQHKVAAFLEKPYDSDALIATIRKILEKK